MDMSQLLGFVLVMTRVGAVLAFLPVLSHGTIPKAVKALLVVAISVCLYPAVGYAVALEDWDPAQFVVFGAAELLFGALIGITAKILFESMRIAGEVFGQQMGMALAHVADPVSGEQSSLVGTFAKLIGMLVFLTVGGHLLMLEALRDSFSQWPLGAFLSPEFVRDVSVTAVAETFVMALKLASPLMLLAFMVSLTMAIMARLVPQMNVLIIGFPLRIGTGLIGLVLFVPLLVQFAGDLSYLVVEFARGVAAGG